MFAINKEDHFDLANIIKYIFMKDFWKYTNWYVFEIVLLYFIFWIVYARVKIQTANKILVVVLLAFIFILYLAEADNPWYGSTMCFPLGIIFAQKEKKFIEFFNRKYILSILISCLILIISVIAFYTMDERSIIGNAFARNSAAVAFSIIMFLVTVRYDIGNKISYYLGTIAYEIFLIHPWVLRCVEIENEKVCTLVCISLTVFFSVLIHKLLKNLRYMIQKVRLTDQANS